jgi:hypothetical protein
MANRNTSKFVSLAFVALVVISGGMALSGVAGATVSTDPANFSAVGNDTLSNQEFTVANDTRSLYVDLDNSEYNATEPVNATVYGVDSEGNETQVEQVQISAASGSVESYEYTSLDPAAYPSYRVEVTGNGSAIESPALDVGMVGRISGGGGLLGGSSIGGVPVLVVIVAGAGYLLFVRD